MTSLVVPSNVKCSTLPGIDGFNLDNQSQRPLFTHFPMNGTLQYLGHSCSNGQAYSIYCYCSLYRSLYIVYEWYALCSVNNTMKKLSSFIQLEHSVETDCDNHLIKSPASAFRRWLLLLHTMIGQFLERVGIIYFYPFLLKGLDVISKQILRYYWVFVYYWLF